MELRMQCPCEPLRRFDDSRAGDDELVSDQDVNAAIPYRRYCGEAGPAVALGEDPLRGQWLPVAQLDDDVWRARQHHFRAGLHGLSRDLGEYVRAAGGDEQVVQESDAAARVDVAQRARL